MLSERFVLKVLSECTVVFERKIISNARSFRTSEKSAHAFLRETRALCGERFLSYFTRNDRSICSNVGLNVLKSESGAIKTK